MPSRCETDIDKWAVIKIAMLEEMVSLLFNHLLSNQVDQYKFIRETSEQISNSIYSIDSGTHTEVLMASFDRFFAKSQKLDLNS